jgi:pimeloyl-ACP methyl ester carboxylesterase
MTAIETITRPDGRRVGVHHLTTGRPDRTVLFCHGAPGSGSFDPGPAATLAHDVTLIGVDRPGYGASDPVPTGSWSTVAAAADDAAAVLDHLGPARVGVAGWSAGGRVALALVARRPDLVDRVAVIATPAPDEEVPWIDERVREAIGFLRGLPPEQVHAVMAEQMAGAAPSDGSYDAALELLGVRPVDADVMASGDTRQRLVGMLTETFAQGVTGMVADVAGYTLQPWGFVPAEVKAETLLLYGKRDDVAGPAHGAWYADRIVGARLDTVPDAGHLVVVPAWERVLAHLCPTS